MGANGSGKSNVVDAIRWCLGEQNVRDLRAQRTEDVIYAGPRKVIGAAEVSLTFEAEGDEAPWSEMELSRRLLRSGDSEYLVNRDRARLRDMLDSLRSIGIDSSRNIIINQGMADFFLTASPLERRGLLEQAAGLSGYRQKREEARQKLAATSQNVQMLEAVLTEIDPRLRSLRRQSRAFEEREEVRQRLQVALSGYLSGRWEDVLGRKAELAQSADALGQRRREIERDLDRLERASEMRLEAERAWQREMDAATAAAKAVSDERGAAERRLQRLQDQKSASRAAIADLDSRLSRLAGGLTEAQQRANEAMAARDRASSERDMLDGEAERHRGALNALSLEAGSARDRAEEARIRLERADATFSQTAEQEARWLRELEWLRERRRQLEVRLRQREQTAVDIARELEVGFDHLSSTESELESAMSSLLRSRSEMASLGSRLERMEAVVRRVVNAQRLAESRLTVVQKGLERLSQDRSVAPAAGLSVSEGWERAVAAALALHQDGFRGDPLPEAALADFRSWRSRLEREMRVTLTWADSEVAGIEDEQHPLRSTILVERPEEAAGLWERVRLRQAHLVGTPPVQIVSGDGRLWSAFGQGAPVSRDSMEQFLLRRREMEHLRRRCASLAARKSQIDEVLAIERQRGRELRAVLEERETGAEGCRRRADELRASIAQLEHGRRNAQADCQAAQRELVAMEGEMRRLAAALDQARAEMKTLSAGRAEAERQWQASLEESERGQEHLTVAARALSEAERQLEIVRTRAEAHGSVAAAAQGEIGRMRDESALLGERRTSTATFLADLESETQAAETDLERLLPRVESSESAVQHLRARRPSEDQVSVSLRELRAQLSDVVGQHERDLARLDEVRREEMDLAMEVDAELGIEPAQLAQPPERRVTAEEVRKLRARAAQYAEADQSVVVECRELEERRTYLRRQLDDLLAASATLEETIEIADRQMTDRFAHAFSAVNDEFSRVFQMMFGGGDAFLEQVGEDNGIDVRAHLPGRRSRSSTAFSGGEKSLVATSLLLAVLRIRPTPFLVLDEVDAALDESNVDRFLVALRDVSLKTQIIIVTHNRATMAAADVLYGLTMDAEGSSSALSLRLDAYERAG